LLFNTRRRRRRKTPTELAHLGKFLGMAMAGATFFLAPHEVLVIKT